MTRDEALIIARQHGAWQPLDLLSNCDRGDILISPSQLLAFVKAVEEAERERCAKVCESLQVNKSQDYFPWHVFDGACRSCAAAIRKRYHECHI